MRINHNISALNTYSRLSAANAMQAKSLEKLSSGLRINRAGDDAAGLAISEKMRNQIRGLEQAARNAQDGISLIQTAEGALNETHSMLLRMRELVVQGNNDTNTYEDRQRIQEEIEQLKSEITAIVDKTEFNTKKLIDGTLGVKIASGTTLTVASLRSSGVSVELSGIKGGSKITISNDGTDSITITVGNTTQTIDNLTLGSLGPGVLNFDKVGVKLVLSNTVQGAANLFSGTLNATGAAAVLQIGANANQFLDISINDMSAEALGNGINTVSEIDVTNDTLDFNTELDILDNAIKQVSAERSKMGAWQNRLEHTINNLNTASENLTAAESRIRDVDMAKEIMEFTKNNILQQAATAMLAQANQQPQAVLQLLR